MYPIYITLVIIISVLALLGTILAGRQTNQSEDAPVDAELTSSSKGMNKKPSNIKVLSYIYAVTFLITGIVIVIFIF